MQSEKLEVTLQVRRGRRQESFHAVLTDYSMRSSFDNTSNGAHLMIHVEKECTQLFCVFSITEGMLFFRRLTGRVSFCTAWCDPWSHVESLSCMVIWCFRDKMCDSLQSDVLNMF